MWSNGDDDLGVEGAAMTSFAFVVGCDPGTTGYLCMMPADVDPPSLSFPFTASKAFPVQTAPTRQAPLFFPTPVLTGADVTRVGKDTDFDLPGMLALARCFSSWGVGLVVLEEQQGFPGTGQKCLSCGKPQQMQGVASTFFAGSGYGAFRMAFEAAGLRVERVKPQEWMGPFGLDSDKKRHVAKARELLPTDDFKPVERTPKARAADHNRADAFLLALHARKLWARQNGVTK